MSADPHPHNDLTTCSLFKEQDAYAPAQAPFNPPRQALFATSQASRVLYDAIARCQLASNAFLSLFKPC
jgi:hypothetical protein